MGRLMVAGVAALGTLMATAPQLVSETQHVKAEVLRVERGSFPECTLTILAQIPHGGGRYLEKQITAKVLFDRASKNLQSFLTERNKRNLTAWYLQKGDRIECDLVRGRSVGSSRWVADNIGREGSDPISNPYMKLTVKTTKSTYKAGEAVEFVITLTNRSSSDAAIELTSGQMYDVALVGADDVELWRWSDDKMFTMQMGKIRLAAGQERVWRESWNQKTRAGKELLPGTYKILAYVPTAAQPALVSSGELRIGP